MAYPQFEGRRYGGHRGGVKRFASQRGGWTRATLIGEYEPVYNELGELAGLRKKLKKIGNIIAKPIQKLTAKGPLKTVKKVLRKQAAFSVGLATAGLVKPKFVGVKQKGSKKFFRAGGLVGKAVIAVVAAPIVAPYLASAGSAVLGGLKFAGGKLVSAPKNFLSMLTGKGKNPATMSSEEVVQAGVESGQITPGILDQLGPMIPGLVEAVAGARKQPGVEYPGGTDYPSAPGGVPQDQPAGGGGIMTTLGPMLPWIGVGVVAIVVLPALLKGRK